MNGTDEAKKEAGASNSETGGVDIHAAFASLMTEVRDKFNLPPNDKRVVKVVLDVLHSRLCTELKNEGQSILPDAINSMRDICHAAAFSCGWWFGENGEMQCATADGKRSTRNIGELLALCHSELSEALEGARKNLQDQHLPHRKSLEVELADCVIRIFDMAGGLGLDIGGALYEKLKYNMRRSDHTLDARSEADGKKF